MSWNSTVSSWVLFLSTFQNNSLLCLTLPRHPGSQTSFGSKPLPQRILLLEEPDLILHGFWTSPRHFQLNMSKTEFLGHLKLREPRMLMILALTFKNSKFLKNWTLDDFFETYIHSSWLLLFPMSASSSPCHHPVIYESTCSFHFYITSKISLLACLSPLVWSSSKASTSVVTSTIYLHKHRPILRQAPFILMVAIAPSLDFLILIYMLNPLCTRQQEWAFKNVNRVTTVFGLKLFNGGMSGWLSH